MLYNLSTIEMLNLVNMLKVLKVELNDTLLNATHSFQHSRTPEGTNISLKLKPMQLAHDDRVEMYLVIDGYSTVSRLKDKIPFDAALDNFKL